jgi:hypothetical protein
MRETSPCTRQHGPFFVVSGIESMRPGTLFAFLFALKKLLAGREYIDLATTRVHRPFKHIPLPRMMIPLLRTLAASVVLFGMFTLDAANATNPANPNCSQALTTSPSNTCCTFGAPPLVSGAVSGTVIVSCAQNSSTFSNPIVVFQALPPPLNNPAPGSTPNPRWQFVYTYPTGRGPTGYTMDMLFAPGSTQAFIACIDFFNSPVDLAANPGLVGPGQNGCDPQSIPVAIPTIPPPPTCQPYTCGQNVSGNSSVCGYAWDGCNNYLSCPACPPPPPPCSGAGCCSAGQVFLGGRCRNIPHPGCGGQDEPACK